MLQFSGLANTEESQVMADANASDSPQVDFAHCLEAARAGCRESLGRLLVGYRPYLQSVADRLLGGQEHRTPDSVLDLVQETYLLATGSFGGFHGTTDLALRWWLRRILVRLIADYRVERARRPGQIPADQQSVDLQTPSSRAIQQEKRQELDVAVAQLRADDRLILSLRFRDRWSWDAIGRRLGKSADAARMLHVRALRHLARLLSPGGA
jgi:RNA polymerase sigma factor (sigma-70 family)